jgi:hypothetical protein
VYLPEALAPQVTVPGFRARDAANICRVPIEQPRYHAEGRGRGLWSLGTQPGPQLSPAGCAGRGGRRRSCARAGACCTDGRARADLRRTVAAGRGRRGRARDAGRNSRADGAERARRGQTRLRGETARAERAGGEKARRAGAGGRAGAHGRAPAALSPGVSSAAAPDRWRAARTAPVHLLQSAQSRQNPARGERVLELRPA